MSMNKMKLRSMFDDLVRNAFDFIRQFQSEAQHFGLAQNTSAGVR